MRAFIKPISSIKAGTSLFVAFVCLVAIELTEHTLGLDVAKHVILGEWKGSWGDSQEKGTIRFIVYGNGEVKGSVHNDNYNLDGIWKGKMDDPHGSASLHEFTYWFGEEKDTEKYRGHGKVAINPSGHLVGIVDLFRENGSSLGTIALDLEPVTQGVIISISSKEDSYCNREFGFAVKVPRNWLLYTEIVEKDQTTISFGLPKIWSDIEKQEIENDISIRACRREAIQSVEDLVELDVKRTKDILTSKRDVPTTFGKAFIQQTVINGLPYKSWETYHFTNNVGYVISFTATEGTFEQNVSKYESFLKSIVFEAPEKKK